MAGPKDTPQARERCFILGTAGHVDHGKTELVRALTGRDTDRLKEEKERGISIELGFAPMPLGDSVFIGVVDVPGHERFVKQMVSGAGGLDMAMLLVAADEGVMPQTREHMEVLRSLDIGCGVVVVSKCDLGSDDTMELLRDEIAELTAGSFLEGAAVVETSAKTGAGLDTLRSTLLELTRGVPERPTSGAFRLAVDRVFHQKGIGVVVTGSCYSGRATVGDALELLPSGNRVRVRELQSFGEKRDSGGAGERLAVALQGVKLGDVRRGDALCTPGSFIATTDIDARVRLAAYDIFEVKNRERLRIHHGAREVLGRVILLESELLGSGDDALVQFRLETPLVPGEGDHFVLRKYSPARVIGGGVVIDADPDRHKRFDDSALERIKLKEQGDPADVLLGTIALAGRNGVRKTDAGRDAVAQLVARNDVVEIGGWLFSSRALDDLASQSEDFVSAHLARHPLQWGMDKEELRRRLDFPHASQQFNRVLEVLTQRRPLFVRENRVRVGSESMDLPEDVTKRIDALEEEIRKRGVAFASRGELESEWHGQETFADAFQLLRERGGVIEMGESGVIHRDALTQALETLRQLLGECEAISVGDYKDSLGLTRKHAIPLLEYFDARRITSRSGNERVRGPAFGSP